MKKKKTSEEELLSFMKSNKDRRKVLAEREGFTNVAKYKEYLEMKVQLAGQSEVEPENTEEIGEDNVVDMVIAFDTTGSMASYIDSVKEHVQELIPKLLASSSNLRLSIVAFGDYCDMNNYKQNDFGKAYQVLGLTRNENELIKFVTNAQNTFGGDGDEFYELVIKKVVEETSWRQNARKSLLLIGDSKPHNPGYYYGGVTYNIDWKEEVKKAANLGIEIDTLKIHKDVSWYDEASKTTGGVCLNFNNSQKTSQIVEGLTYARSSEASYNTFASSEAVTSDKELFGAVKQMGTLVD